MAFSVPDTLKEFLPPDNELDEKFILTGGPGGQHVNKTESGVQLSFDTQATSRLAPAVISRLLRLAGSRASADGVVTIEARSHRSQHRNREDARCRLAELIKQAHKKPRNRIATRPTRASKKKRLEGKRIRSRVKAKRGKPGMDD